MHRIPGDPGRGGRAGARMGQVRGGLAPGPGPASYSLTQLRLLVFNCVKDTQHDGNRPDPISGASGTLVTSDRNGITGR